ncbi:hypothetical protein TNCV_3309541 [Trichonephila clavipes]|nr:hypothetical protein TNCV_3309541 [Trichonephila clavipes]
MVLKVNDRRTSCPCHDEFRGPRSDYVRQVALDNNNSNNSVEFRLESYARAFGDGPRNFEPWSSNEEDTRAESPLLTATPHQREDV